jgi:hypothetical protein
MVNLLRFLSLLITLSTKYFDDVSQVLMRRERR